MSECNSKVFYLDKVAFVVCTCFPKQSEVHRTMRIQQIQNWVGILSLSLQVPSWHYLGKTSCEHHNFEQISQMLQKLIDVRSLQNIHFVNLIFNFHRNYEIWIGYWLKTEQRSRIFCTLNELCTSVSSKSNTRHFLPAK